jgi:hypothetical protein
MSLSSHTSNVGLLDARGTAQVLYTLSIRFRAVEFADWCTIAEEIVLRDYIILVGKLDRLPRHLQLVLEPYIQAGIFRPLREAFSVPRLPADPIRLQATQDAITQGLTETTAEDATFEASRLLGAEARTGAPATQLLRHMQHFGLVRRPKVETMIWDLAGQYRKLSDALLDVRRRYRQFAGLPTISIPPIALLGVSRCRHFDELFSAVLQLRDDFASLRRKMSELQEQLVSDRLTPGEALRVESIWRKRWQALAENFGTSNSLALAYTSMPLLLDGAKIAISAAKYDIFSTVHAAISAIGHGVSALGSLQLRPVHKPVSNYMRTRDPEIRRAVARIFQYDFVKLDTEMHLLATQPGNPWMLATKPVQLGPASRPTPRQVFAETRGMRPLQSSDPKTLSSPSGARLGRPR